MRFPFAAATILAAFLGVFLTASRNDARYSTSMALADLAEGKLPGESIASSLEAPNVAAGLRRLSEDVSTDPLLAVAAAEMRAAGVIEQDPDSAVVLQVFEGLARRYPGIPLIQYRSAAYLLARTQLLAGESGPAPQSAECPVNTEIRELSLGALEYLAKAIEADPGNSLYYYEAAYSHLVLGDDATAYTWFLRAGQAKRLDSGDDVILSSCDRLVSLAGAPLLERRISTYHAARYGPSFLCARLERLAARVLSDVQAGKAPEGLDGATAMMALEDLSDKLLQSAKVVRESQTSIIIDGLLWRQAARIALRNSDAALLAEARRRLAEAGYRYLLIGWQKSAAGLIPQQTVVEMDTPIDLRLDFSRAMQRLAGALLPCTMGLLVLSGVAGAAGIRERRLRQPALALVTLAAFVFLGYAGCFCSLASERTRTSGALERRLSVMTKTPQYLRERGHPTSRTEFDTEIAKRMLFTFDYTLQAARVLSYVGTRDCFEALVGAMDDPEIPCVGEVAVVLREATGQDFGYRVANPKSTNYEAVRAWRQWWKANREQYPESPPAS